MKEAAISMEDYLKPTATVDCDNQLIRGKALSLTKEVGDTPGKAKRLFYWVRDEIEYNPLVPLEIFESYRASETLKRGEGFCVEKAALLAALARAVGIAARLHFADIRNHLVSSRLLEVMGTNLFSYHGYTELYIGEKWIKATPAFDLKMCQEHRIIPVEFDGQNHALFHSHDCDGKLHIEYVKDHGQRIDVPVEEILAAWMQHYGVGAQERLNRALREENAGKKR
ncbi:MAG: transglutaminase family protein [Dehalococcoidia bacterium]|nr:transglutaminase family protein [Dehalococcoidia bacterium]